MARMSTATQSAAFCELSSDDKQIEVYFAYNRFLKDAVKAIPGSRFHAEGEHGPYWTVPARMENARALRQIFGEGLELGQAVRKWGHITVGTQNQRTALTSADTYPVDKLRISKTHPELAAYLREYQRADVALMSQVNVLNTNQPGTGKTVEVLAALCEAGLDQGAHLIVAPIASLENVWRIEIEKWIPNAHVYTSEDATERKQQVLDGIAAIKDGQPSVWILTNVDFIRPKKLAKNASSEGIDLLAINDWKQPRGRYHARNDIHTALLGVEWDSYTMDEFHKTGLNTRDSLTTWGSSVITAKRRFLLSGTPMGGVPDHLFAPLRDIEPVKFSSYWRWAGQWLVVEEDRLGHKIVGDIKPGQEDAFFQDHAQHMIRRLKREALPGLPEKVRTVVRCEMTKKQAAQYRKFEKDAEVRIDNAMGGTDMLAADCILAEYSRAKQFANAYCAIDDKGRVVPTTDSGKLVQLVQKLDEFGVRAKDYEPGARAIVASQSARMAEMTAEYLTDQGIDCGLLTGDTKDRKALIDHFTGGPDTPYVLVMTTKTGGVSINLERASSVHVLDESWNPDEEEQLEDRGDRGSRTTPLVCLYYRSVGTIQDRIAAVAQGKAVTNRNVLDLYRQMRKEGKS